MRFEQGSWVGLPVFSRDAENLGIWNNEEPDPAQFTFEDDRFHHLLKNIPDKIEGEDDSSNTPKDRRIIHAEIDITMSLESILHEVTRRVNFARRRYEAQVESLPDRRRKPRKRMDQYSIYLRVWQLRKEQGWTFERIARSIFPNEMEGSDRYSPVIKRVRSQYQRACELIAGDYRQIES